MGVHTHFDNFIVPIEKIENSGFKGGFKKFINQFTSEIGSSIFFDKYIVNFIEGPFGLSYEIRYFCEKYGLEGVVETKDGLYWKDYCEYSKLKFTFEFEDNQEPIKEIKCDWLEHTGSVAYMKGTPICPSYPESGKASYYRSFEYKNRNNLYGMGII